MISDAELDWQTERQARFAAGNVLDAVAPTNFPLVEPGRAARDRRRGRREPRPRREALRRRRLLPPRLPQSVDTSQFEVGGNLAVDPGLGRAPHRGLRADPVQAGDRAGARGPAAARPADDQQVLHPRPRARPSFVEYLVAQGQQVFVVSWRNPTSRAGPLRPRHLRERGARGPRRRRRDHAAAGGPPQRGVLGRDHHRRRRRAPRCRGARARRRREPDAVRERARQRARRHGGRVHEPRRRPRPRSPSPPAAATSTARRSPACSPGCARTTSSGTTSSTTTCWARSRPRSTSCTGTRTPCGSPPACTATSSGSRSTTAGACRRLSVLGSPVDLGAVDARQLHRRRPQGPHRAVGERLPGHAAARRREALRALDQRPHPGDGQPARAGLARQLPRRRRAPRGPEAFLETAAKLPGSWWPDYARVARRALGRPAPAPPAARRPGHRALGKAPGTYVLAS